MASSGLEPGDDLVAGALAAACGDPEVLGRIAGPLGTAARAAVARPRDRETRARWAARARTAVPAGLRGVHPSWIEAALCDLPPRARVAVASGGVGGGAGSPDRGGPGDAPASAIDVWLARLATAAIPPMPAVTAARVTSIDSATRVDAAVLARWLDDAGADQLALALGAAGAGAVAAAAQIVGERLVVAAARITRAPRAGALGPVRAAIVRSRVALDDRALLAIGARAVAPHLDALARRRIVHRLPRVLGLVVAAALEAAARAALAEAPRWDALTAA